MFKKLLIPESSPRYNDMIDAVTQSATKTIDVVQKDGTIIKEQVLDEEILWWKLLDVSDEKFARFAFELKEWERLAQVAFYSMPKERAEQMAHDIIEIGLSYRRSIDAKGSESRRDHNNSKSTILDKIGKNKIEKVYSLHEEGKKSLADSFLGRKARDDSAED